MFQYERPNIPVSSPETAPLYNYLYRFVEYCNVMLNHIGADQIEDMRECVRSFVNGNDSVAEISVNTGSADAGIRVRRVMGMVFLHIGNMTNVPSGDSTLTTLPPEYRPSQDETYDYTTATWQYFRVTVKSTGDVVIHSYSSSTQATVDSNIRMIYPAANI